MKEWKEISSIEQWEQILEDSEGKPFVILKHSTACPVSFNALEEYETYLSGTINNQLNYYLVKVIESRPVSNQIAEATNIKHASPQIVYVNNRQPVWNSSHWSITAAHMKAVLD